MYLNIILDHNKRECQYYKHMDMWNEQRTSTVNQMLADGQENDKHHSFLDVQHNAPIIII